MPNKKKIIKKPALRKKRSAKNLKKQDKKLIVADGEHCFWIHEGPVIKSLKDLRGAFTKMTHEQFQYHANDMKNDFAAWVEYVLQDPECANSLRKCGTKASAQSCVQNALKKYR